MKKLAFILIIFLTSCLLSENCNNNSCIEELDDDKVAVISDEVTKKWLSSNNYRLFQPTMDDFNDTEDILKKTIKNGEFNFLKEPILLQIKDYYRQYVFYFDDNNHKIVRINAFCRILQTPIEVDEKTVWEPFDWRNKLFVVNDGGNCYWTITINLTTKENSVVIVNGV